MLSLVAVRASDYQGNRKHPYELQDKRGHDDAPPWPCQVEVDTHQAPARFVLHSLPLDGAYVDCQVKPVANSGTGSLHEIESFSHATPWMLSSSLDAFKDSGVWKAVTCGARKKHCRHKYWQTKVWVCAHNARFSSVRAPRFLMGGTFLDTKKQPVATSSSSLAAFNDTRCTPPTATICIYRMLEGKKSQVHYEGEYRPCVSSHPLEYS